MIVLLAGMAAAEEPGSGVVVNDDLELRYWRSDERLPGYPDNAVYNYLEQVNRLNIGWTRGSWTFEAQVDEVALFANRHYLGDDLIIENDLLPDGDAPLYGQSIFNVMPGDSYLNPEKVRARYESKVATVTLGDAYSAFGRGFALNLNRNVDIDIDTSIQGAKVVWRPGMWDVTALAGQTNPQQVSQDNPNEVIEGDRRHLITGVRAERFGLGPANVGAHVVGYGFADGPGWDAAFSTVQGLDALVGGATAEALGIGGFDVFLEADAIGLLSDRVPGAGEPGERPRGAAVYGSVSTYPGPVTILVEGKRTVATELINAVGTVDATEYMVGPSLEYERAINEDTSSALNSNDIGGGRVQIDVAVVPGKVIPYVSCATFRDLDVGGAHFNPVPETIVHPVVGMEVLLHEVSWLVDVGYRVDDRDGTNLGADRQLHGNSGFHTPIAGPVHADWTVQFERFQWGANAFQQSDFFEVENALTLGWGKAVALIGYLDTTTNPLVDTTGNLSETAYGAAEIQVRPASAWTIKAFYGAYKAGIRCAGGQCRQLPGFDGARLAVLGTF